MNTAMQTPTRLTAVEASQTTQVDEQVRALGGIATDLGMMADTLEKRLITVIRPYPNQKEEQPNAPEPVLVPLADQMKNIARHLNQSVDRLRQLNSAIEVPFS